MHFRRFFLLVFLFSLVLAIRLEASGAYKPEWEAMSVQPFPGKIAVPDLLFWIAVGAALGWAFFSGAVWILVKEKIR